MVKFKTKGKNLLGAWAFLIGVILAIVIGIFHTQIGPQADNIILASLIVIGILVGLLNIRDTEVEPFLLSALALVIVSFMGGIAIAELETLSFGLGSMMRYLLNAMLTLFVPATIIVALKSVFALARD